MKKKRSYTSQPPWPGFLDGLVSVVLITIVMVIILVIFNAIIQKAKIYEDITEQEKVYGVANQDEQSLKILNIRLNDFAKEESNIDWSSYSLSDDSFYGYLSHLDGIFTESIISPITGFLSAKNQSIYNVLIEYPKAFRVDYGYNHPLRIQSGLINQLSKIKKNNEEIIFIVKLEIVDDDNEQIKITIR